MPFAPLIRAGSLCAGLSLTLSVPTLAQQEVAGPHSDDWVVARQEGKTQLTDASAVEISNPYGDVRVRTGASGELYFVTNYQHHRDDPRRPDFSVEQRDGAVSLVVRYSEVEGLASNDDVPGDWKKRRVDIAVFVPTEAQLDLETAFGLAEVRGVRGAITIETTTGTVRARVVGPLTVTTEHGEVLAQLLSTKWDTPSRIASKTGTVRVELPREPSFRATLATRGEVTSDFSMTLERVGPRLKRGSMEIREGGGELTLESYQGALQVVEMLVPEDTN